MAPWRFKPPSRAADQLVFPSSVLIKNAFVEALYAAVDSGNEPTDLDIAQVLTEFVPLSKLMAEQITGLGNWAKGRARLATSPNRKEAGLGLGFEKEEWIVAMDSSFLATSNRRLSQPLGGGLGNPHVLFNKARRSILSRGA